MWRLGCSRTGVVLRFVERESERNDASVDAYGEAFFLIRLLILRAVGGAEFLVYSFGAKIGVLIYLMGWAFSTIRDRGKARGEPLCALFPDAMFLHYSLLPINTKNFLVTLPQTMKGGRNTLIPMILFRLVFVNCRILDLEDSRRLKADTARCRCL